MAINSAFVNKAAKDKAIYKMIRSFELVARDRGTFDLTYEEYKEYNSGMNAFNKHFLTLWY